MTWQRFTVLGIAMVMCLGCGGTPDGQRPTAPVEVTVTYKGKPVEGALVQFITADKPQPSQGTTNAEGKCSLTTYKQNDGAIIGSNLVTISKAEIDKKPRPSQSVKKTKTLLE